MGKSGRGIVWSISTGRAFSRSPAHYCAGREKIGIRLAT
jgi:hypothetical protein